LLKAKLSFVKVGALFLVENLFKVKKKTKKKIINIIVKPQTSSLRSESKKDRSAVGEFVHLPFGPRTG
jgi:hypothetical protein